MSRHQFYRNLDYQAVMEEDAYSEEENELSPEDRAQLKQGTADVQAALGVEASKVTAAQIEEALWHYYYDLDKTVTYLTSKFINPRPKATKPAPQQPNGKSVTRSIGSPPAGFFLELDTPAYWATKFPDLPNAAISAPEIHPASLITWWQPPSPLGATPTAAALPYRPTFAGVFRDMPWGNIPKHRETTFIPPPTPRGGLLGGSGAPPKMSKLQALAAARKKKAEEKNAVNDKMEQARMGVKELSVKDPLAERQNLPMAGPLSKRLKTSDSTTHDNTLPVFAANPTPSGPAQTEPAQPTVAATAPKDEPPLAKAQPSAFARTLFGSSSKSNALKPLVDKPKVDFPFCVGQAPKPTAAALELGPAFEIQKRKRDDCDEYETTVVLYPNLPQFVRDNFAQPSPDDIVFAAQAKAKGKAGQKTTAQSKKKGTQSTAAVTAGVNELKIDDTPLPKSRNLDVVSEFEKSGSKRSASFVVIGHVDAGKSTMMGRLLLDLRVVDQRAVDRLRKEAETIGKSSFALAWVLDQTPEERSRGVTVDVATNRFETEHTAFTVLDAPGHKDFIPNMIAGASQADFAILVIDASTGAFESGLRGQTKEHSLLIRSMGVSRVIVAINKLDMVAWSQERFNEIKDQMTGFLSSAGFQHKNIAFVPASGLHGGNLAQRTSDPAASWYTGPTLIEELEKSEPNARALAKPLRMTISEVFRTMQSPVTVSGRIDAGSLQMGDAILVQPSGEKAYVKSLLADDAPADWAVAGQNVVLHLSHIDAIHVRVADIICDPARPIPRADTFTLKALAFDFLTPMQVDVHRGRLHSAGEIQTVLAILDKVTGAVTKKKPKVVKPGTVARIVIKLRSQVPLEAGQRVVVRSGGQTVAAGLLE